MARWVCFAFCTLAFAQAPLTDASIQEAINVGESIAPKKLYKELEKRRIVKIDSLGKAFKYGVWKKATIYTSTDLIEAYACEGKRLHQRTSVEDIKSKRIDSGFLKIFLMATTNASGTAALARWQAPGVHMILTVNGTEIQPLEKGTDNETYYPSTQFEYAHSKCWFTFRIPPASGTIKITAISSDGTESSVEFGSSILN